MNYAYKTSVRKSEGKTLLERRRHTCYDNIKTDIEEIIPVL